VDVNIESVHSRWVQVEQVVLLSFRGNLELHAVLDWKQVKLVNSLDGRRATRNNLICSYSQIHLFYLVD